MVLRFHGLDGEMSGSDLAAGHRLIQIGVAVDTAPDGTRLAAPDVFSSLVGWPPPDLPWDDRAAAVHGIPRAAVLAAPRARVVDEQLHDWLVERGARADRRVDQVMVGFNVGAFDAPFLAQALPRSHALFSRRYADLNPLCFALGDYDAWRARLERTGLDAAARAGRTEGAHDAGTDAVAALAAWREVEGLLATVG